MYLLRTKYESLMGYEVHDRGRTDQCIVTGIWSRGGNNRSLSEHTKENEKYLALSNVKCRNNIKMHVYKLLKRLFCYSTVNKTKATL